MAIESLPWIMDRTEIETCFAEFPTRDWQQQEVEGSVRVAVVGLGQLTQNRALPAISASAFCELTVLVSGSPDKAERLAAEYGADHVLSYEAFQDGAAVDAYDAVYIATPNAYHAPYTESAAAHGKHVLCEKPLAATIEEARDMVDACADAGVTLMTAYRLQTEPAVRRIRELVEGGVIGDPVHVSGWFAYRDPDEAAPVDSWRRDASLAGGGAMIDLGVYPLNTARFILDSDPVAAYGTTIPYENQSSPTDGGRVVEKRASFQLEFPSDVTVSGLASFDTYPDNRLQVLGTAGRALIVSPFGGVVPQEVLVERGESRTSYTGAPIDEMVEEFDYFAYCVLTETDPEPDGEDGLADLRVVEAIYESATQGTRVEL